MVPWLIVLVILTRYVHEGISREVSLRRKEIHPNASGTVPWIVVVSTKGERSSWVECSLPSPFSTSWLAEKWVRLLKLLGSQLPMPPITKDCALFFCPVFTHSKEKLIQVLYCHGDTIMRLGAPPGPGWYQ